MRWIPIILLITFCQLSLATYSQSITLSGKNLPLEVIFSAIKKQTGYIVSWNTDLQKAAKPVSITAKNMSLLSFLDLILKDQPFNYEISEKNIILSKKKATNITPSVKSSTNALDTIKKINITARIVNEKGDPVIATITVKGTKQATSSNSAGEFSLKDVNEKSSLLISGINIDPYDIKVYNTDLKTITVKTKIKEEEMVVIANTGYQKLKPNEITGSVTVIDNKTLNQQTGTNIIDRLNGVTPGMLFNVGKINANGTPNPYSIRGISTINGNTSPLIILDNFQYDGDINDINPGDVENITILKDAAAASIYGAQGGNGVIVITTKRGRFNQKLKVEFNAAVTTIQKPDLYVIPQLSSAEYIYLEEFFFNRGVDFGSANAPSSSITPVINILTKRRANLISAADSASQIDALKQIDSRDDLNKYFYQHPVTRQYSLNLRGGSNNLAWILSGSYDKSTTSLAGAADRINVKLNNEYKPLKNLNISFTTYYTNASTQTGKSIPGPYRKIPYLNYADENGTPLSTNTKQDLFLDTVGAGHLLDWHKFPLEDYKHDRTTTRREQLVAGIETRYTFLRGLDLSLSYQYQREWGGSERYADIESYYARDKINSFAQLSRTSAPDIFPIPKGGILQVENASEHSYNFRAQLGFQRDWQQRKHAVNTIMAVERREFIQDPGSRYTLYGYNKDPLTQVSVDYNNNDIGYPNFITGTPNSIDGAPFIGRALNSRFISLLGNVTYTYKERYSFSASARRDAANVFGLTTNNKWKPLWSAGVAWDMSKESFYHFTPLPHLKWRFTYGYSGNVDLSKTALTILTYSGFTTLYGDPYASASRPNPDLRWEKKQDFNIAMEFSTKNNGLSGSIEYYQKKCTDLYGQTLYDYSTYGLNETILANVANTKGNGVDITITSRNIDKTVKWNTTLLFNYSRDVVTNYYSPDAQNGRYLLAEQGNGKIATPVIGKPLYAMAAFKWGGLDSIGNPQGYYQGKLSSVYTDFQGELNKGLNSESIVYIGPSNPPFFGSLINALNWKGFSLNVNLIYKLGYYFRKPIFSQMAWLTDGTGYGDFSKRWQKTGDELATAIPSLLYPAPNGVDLSQRDNFYKYSAVNVLKADHIRLQYINMSYSFTRQKQHVPLSYLQVYLNVANLGIVWRANKEKIDPDYPASAPPSKSFTIGLRANL